jgi:hypothetical protein
LAERALMGGERLARSCCCCCWVFRARTTMNNPAAQRERDTKTQLCSYAPVSEGALPRSNRDYPVTKDRTLFETRRETLFPPKVAAEVAKIMHSLFLCCRLKVSALGTVEKFVASNWFDCHPCFC